MKPNQIHILDTGIYITALHVDSRDAARYVGALPEDQRGHAVAQAVEVGVFCLERARAGQDFDFVRREVDSLLSGVQGALQQLPAQTEAQITAKIGTGEGQVLAPIKELVTELSKVASDKVSDIRTLLQEEIDPRKETSSLGKALGAVRELLDPKRTRLCPGHPRRGDQACGRRKWAFGKSCA